MTKKKPTPPQYEVFERIGESQTRLELTSGSWGERGPVVAAAQEWLRLKEENRILEASSRRDAREEETLAIARRANRIAVAAMITSAIATTATIVGVYIAR